MRGKTTTLALIMLLLALPNVAAGHGDDPRITIPDSDPAADAAEDAAADQRATTTAFTSGTWWTSSQAVNGLQADVESMPLHVVDDAVDGSGALVNDTRGNTAGFALTASGWTSEIVFTKLNEVSDLLTAAEHVGVAAADSTGVIVAAIYATLCHPQLNVTACDDGSIAGAITEEVEGLVDWSEAETEKGHSQETQDAALRLVTTVAPFLPDA